VHLDHVEFPILGDYRYGDDEANGKAKKLGLRRLFLHAQSIAFPDDSGNEHHFTATLAEDLDKFLRLCVKRKRRTRY
jgi:23S rRNA pseudouridine955/2504/2580 synthase